MGIDPMVFGSGPMTGVLELGSGPILWWMTVGGLAAVAAAIALSVLRLERIVRLRPPRLVHAQFAAVSPGRVK